MTTETSNFSTRVEIYSRRWGHSDTWTFTKTPSGWDIRSGAHSASVGPDGLREANDARYDLLKLASNDHVDLPSTSPRFFKFLWEKLDSGDSSIEEVKVAIEHWASWVSSITRDRPGRNESVLFAEYYG